MKRFAILIINFYRKYLSILKLPTCRFYPTCSQYAIEALKKKGFFQGSLLSLKRLLRCHPFCDGGYDPVDPALSYSEELVGSRKTRIE